MTFYSILNLLRLILKVVLGRAKISDDTGADFKKCCKMILVFLKIIEASACIIRLLIFFNEQLYW